MLQKPKRVLVVGGGGFIGTHVVRAFLDTGAEVSVLDMLGSARDDVNWITGSISDLTLVASAANGCDTVVFLANSSLPGSSHAELSAEVSAHVYATIKSAEISCSVGVKQFIFASSGGTVYGFAPAKDEGLRETDPTMPRNAYGVSKLSIEHYLRLMSAVRPMRTLALRISNPYGEGQRAARAQGIIAAAMATAMSGAELPIWGDGSIERDFVHVSDVARSFVAASVYEGKHNVINIGRGKSNSVREILALIEQITGHKLAIRYEPDRPIDVHCNRLSIDLARDELGWRPEVSLVDGLKRTATWWEQQQRGGA